MATHAASPAATTALRVCVFLCALAYVVCGPTSREPQVILSPTEESPILNSIDTQPAGAEPDDGCPPFVTREQWGAAPPKLVEQQPDTSRFVIVHHTYIPGACNTSATCVAAMQSMQSFHQITRGWNDIGYSFLVGGDGNVYVGRGWGVVGAHAPRFNDRSVGVGFIGDYVGSAPPAAMTALAQQLIECSVRRGSLVADYRLMGHRQVRDTECPGTAFYQELQRWPHWVPGPDAPLSTTARPAEGVTDAR